MAIKPMKGCGGAALIRFQRSGCSIAQTLSQNGDLLELCFEFKRTNEAQPRSKWIT